MINWRVITIIMVFSLCILSVVGAELTKTQVVNVDAIKSESIYANKISVDTKLINVTTIGTENKYTTIISDLNGTEILTSETVVFNVEGLGQVTKIKCEDDIDISIDTVKTILFNNDVFSVVNSLKYTVSEPQFRYISQVEDNQVITDNGRAIIPVSSKFYGITTSKDNPYQYGTDDWYNYEVKI